MVSWMIMWYLDIWACRLGFKPPLEKLLLYEMDFEIYVFSKWLRNMVIVVLFKFRHELRN